MADLSDFKRGQIVGARMTGELFGVIKSTVLNVMTSSLKQNSGRKRKLFDRDRQTVIRIVKKDHKNRASKITVELNDHLKNPVSSKTVRRDAFHGRPAVRKPY